MATFFATALAVVLATVFAPVFAAVPAADAARPAPPVAAPTPPIIAPSAALPATCFQLIPFVKLLFLIACDAYDIPPLTTAPMAAPATILDLSVLQIQFD